VFSGVIALFSSQPTVVVTEKQHTIDTVQEKPTLNRLRGIIIQAASLSHEGHIPSAFSVLNILSVLYQRVLKIDPNHPDVFDRDRFVLSKGHASLALYAVLADRGFFPLEILFQFASYNSPLGGHPHAQKIPGIEASTGSLGHGFPMAVGMALGLKIHKSANRVYCLVGDGECNEGSIWESALLAAHHQLSNLCCVVDYNHSTDRALSMGDISEKFKAFGWDSLTIDGHNEEEIYDALTLRHENKPLAIVAETIKGYGCKSMENEPAWHHKSPTEQELVELLQELL